MKTDPHRPQEDRAAERAVSIETGLLMRPLHEIITEKFRRSAFCLTFETEEIIAYRASLQGDVLRSVATST